MNNPLALYVIAQQRQHDQRSTPERPRRRPPRRSAGGRRLVAVTAFAVAAVLLVSVVPAAAAPGWYDKRDAVAEPHVRGNNDIVRMRFGNTPIVKLRITTRVGGDPWQHPAWRDPDGGTRITWLLDSDEDPQPEYLVRVASTAEGPQQYPDLIDLEGGSGGQCNPEFSYSTGNHYVLGFRWRCIGSPGRLSAQVRYRFQPAQGAPSTDVAPNGGFTPDVLYPTPI